MSVPKLGSAIPLRRYQLGEFKVVLLGDIKSPDDTPYEFILACIPDGKSEPLLYITCEPNLDKRRGEGARRIRVMAAHGAQVFGSSDRWQDPEAFTEDALAIAGKLLDLADEEPKRLL